MDKKSKSNGKINIKLDYRAVLSLLIITNIVTLFLWSPWNGTSNDRPKITVTGTTVLKATPDQYSFYPMFEEVGTDRQTMTNTVNEKANKLVSRAKELGINDESIKVEAVVYDDYYPFNETPDTKQQRAYVTVQLTAKDKDTAQKVQDVISDLGAKGQLTASGSFSQEKQKMLNDEGSEKAIADAKVQAEKKATSLGKKVGRLVSVDEANNNVIQPYYSKDLAVSESTSGSPLPVMTGEQEIPYSIEVVYELK